MLNVSFILLIVFDEQNRGTVSLYVYIHNIVLLYCMFAREQRMCNHASCVIVCYTKTIKGNTTWTKPPLWIKCVNFETDQ